MMAPSFAAAIGRPTPPMQIAQDGLGITLAADGIVVTAKGDYVDLGSWGVIIGHLFSRSLPSRRIRSLSPNAIERIVGTKGASLLNEYWGGYVAIIRDGSAGWRLFRDPSGAMPVFWRTADRQLFASTEVGREPFTTVDSVGLDPIGLARFLHAPHFITTETCLSGVRELLPGHALFQNHDDWISEEMWSPWTFANSHSFLNAKDGIEQLRDTILDCIGAWSCCFNSILLQLSGGLDSSIVAAGLRCEPDKVRCLTMVAPGAEGDELRYADAVTRALGMPREVERYSLQDVDITRPFLDHLPWPTATMFTQSLAAAHSRLRTERPYDAIFTGNGGDMVFCSMQSVTPLVDRIKAVSGPIALAHTVRDIADVTGADIWTIMGRTLHRFTQRRISRAGTDRSFLNPELLQSAAAEVHPWLSPPKGVLPGRAAHVAMLKRTQTGLEFHSRRTGPLSVAPLLSQPIIEACLGIPSWEWIRGGIDRSAARRAFSDCLPSIIISRRSKGGPSGFMQEIYREHAGVIQDYLWNGTLRRAGILRPDLSAGELRYSSVAESAVPTRLLQLAAAEAWSSSWRSSA